MADPLADHDTVRIFPHWEGGIEDRVGPSS